MATIYSQPGLILSLVRGGNLGVHTLHDCMPMFGIPIQAELTLGAHLGGSEHAASLGPGSRHR